MAYRCPRADLGCAEEFATTGDLDYHTHLAHGYLRMWRYASAFGRHQRVGGDSEPRFANMGPASRAIGEIGTAGAASNLDPYPESGEPAPALSRRRGSAAPGTGPRRPAR